MNRIADPLELYNSLYHLGLRSNEEMCITAKEQEQLSMVYEEVILSYFRALFPKPTRQHFLSKRRDAYGRVEVDIRCRSCGKQLVVHNLRMVFCPHPAPCKNNFHEDKRSLFKFIDTHSLDLARQIGPEPDRKSLVGLLQTGKI